MARVKKQALFEDNASTETAVHEDGTAAAESLRPASRSAMMMQALQALDGMGTEDLSHFLDATLAQIGHEADAIPGDAAAKNAASIAGAAMKNAVKEDLAVVFGDNEQLTEEFRERLETLFETAVNARVSIELAENMEAVIDMVDDYLTETVGELVEQVDHYTSYLTEKFFEENQIAIDKGLTTEISEHFLADLHEVFLRHNITVPEGRIDVVEQLAEQINGLNDQINSLAEQNMELTSMMEQAHAEAVFEAATEKLTATEAEKLRSLCEGLEYDNLEQLEQKIATIKEAHFARGAKAPVSRGATAYERELLSESEGAEERVIDPTVNGVLRSLAAAKTRS